MKRYPYNWSRRELNEAWGAYIDNGGELPFKQWLDKHCQLELACESPANVDVRSLAEALKV